MGVAVFPTGLLRLDSEKSRSLLSLMVLVLLLSLVYGVISWVYIAERNAAIHLFKQSAADRVEMVGMRFMADLDEVLRDIWFLAGHDDLKQYLQDSDQKTLDQLNESWRFFSQTHRIYDQIRLIDLYGGEVARIDYAHGAAIIAGQEKLQYKGNRDYVARTLPLEQNEIYVSRFDLNQEYGEVEEPFKPMLRIATPVFDDDGNKRGILVLNYLADRLLREVQEADEGIDRQVLLLNQPGYYLRGFKSTDEWGFMFPEERGHKTFSHDYPQIWPEISENRHGQIDSDLGVFTYTHISFPASFSAEQTGFQRDWIVVDVASPEMLQVKLASRQKNALLFAGIVTSIFLIVFLLLERVRRQRFAMHQALRVSEERTRLLLESAGEGIFGVDLEGDISFANSTAARMFGYQADELIGKSSRILLYGDDHIGCHLIEACRAQLTGIDSKGHFMDTRLLWRRDGSSFPAEFICTSMKKGDDVIGAVVTFTDITERERVEEELRLAAKTFEIDDAIIITDKQMVILRVNSAFTQMTGYSPKEVMGKNARMLKSGQQSADFYNRMWRDVLKDGSWQGEIWSRHKSGRLYPESMTITAVKDTNGDITHFVAIKRDITERIQFNEKLTKSMQELERINRLMSGREGRVIELKREVNKLRVQLGQSVRYESVE
ncbi:MAG: PAS domain S-box protein [Chromatiales bacterium]|nr:PAS domain S-box protein [Chromatiales bacterium]